MTTEYANKNWWRSAPNATEAKKKAMSLILDGQHSKVEIRKCNKNGEPTDNWMVAHKGTSICLEHDQFRPISQHQKQIDSYEPGQKWETLTDGEWGPVGNLGPQWIVGCRYRRVVEKPKVDWALMPRWANHVFMTSTLTGEGTTETEWMWSVNNPKWCGTYWVVTGLTGVIPSYMCEDFGYAGDRVDSIVTREPEDMLKETAEKTKNDFKVTNGPAPDHNLDLCPCETCVEERADKLKIKEAVYGYCPVCGCAGKYRERRPNGNDTCDAGHTYPSKDAIKKPTKRSGKEIPLGRAGVWYPF